MEKETKIYSIQEIDNAISCLEYLKRQNIRCAESIDISLDAIEKMEIAR